MTTERYSTETSRGWARQIVLWRSRRHQWELTVEWDRVHPNRTGNYLLRVEFIRVSLPL